MHLSKGYRWWSCGLKGTSRLSRSNFSRSYWRLIFCSFKDFVYKGWSAKGHRPLSFIRFGYWFRILFKIFLLIHAHKSNNDFYRKNQQICTKAGRGARLLHAPYAGFYLPSLKPNSLLAGTYITLKRNKWLHSSSTKEPKMSNSKKGIFHLYLPYINYQSRYDLLSQRVYSVWGGHFSE